MYLTLVLAKSGISPYLVYIRVVTVNTSLEWYSSQYNGDGVARSVVELEMLNKLNKLVIPMECGRSNTKKCFVELEMLGNSKNYG